MNQRIKNKTEDLILWENQEYLVVNKPPFISVLDDFASPNNMLKWIGEKKGEVHACHRLDKETSGVLIMAKSIEAYKLMSIQFESRSIKKVYHAVIEGTHNFIQKKLNFKLQTSARGFTKASKSGKESITVVNTLEYFTNHTLLECMPVTGRTHQIRVHLSSLNTPIVGDAKYGGKPLFLSAIKKGFNLKKDTQEQPLIKRAALHANSIKFKLENGEEVSVEAPYPKDFRVLLKQLRKQSPA